MYCPSCGTEYTIELKYCNRCGANLGTSLEEQPRIAPISLTKPVLIISVAMIFLTLAGFGMLIAGAVELSHNARVDPGSITGIIVTGMLTILTMDIFLVRQLSKIISASLSSNTVVQPKRRKELANPAPVQMPQLSTARLQQAVPSVTEGTTRFFESYRTTAEPEDRVTSEKLER